MGIRSNLNRHNIEAMHFVGAPSMSTNVCVSVVGFEGRLLFNFTFVGPSVRRELGQTIVDGISAQVEARFR